MRLAHDCYHSDTGCSADRFGLQFREECFLVGQGNSCNDVDQSRLRGESILAGHLTLESVG